MDLKLAIILYVVVSWIIGYTLVIIGMLKNGRNKPKYIIRAIFLPIFSPVAIALLIIASPVLLYDLIKEQKRKKTIAIEKEKEDAYLKESIELLNSITEYEKIDISALQKKAEDFHNFLHDEQDLLKCCKPKYTFKDGEVIELTYPSWEDILDKVTIQQGYEFGIDGPPIATYGCSRIYVSNCSDKNEKHRDIFNYLTIDYSIEGVWQAYLLFTAWHVMRMHWHGAYDSWDLVYSFQSFEKLRHLNIAIASQLDRNSCFKDLEQLEEMDLRERADEITTKIAFVGDSAFVQSCYWKDFGGLYKYKVRIGFDNGKVKCTEVQKQCIAHHHSGIQL